MNVIAEEWKKRYDSLPLDIKRKVEELHEKPWKEYQLKVIQRKKDKPKKGDIFVVNPVMNLYFYGRVINSEVNNISGNNLYVIVIYKQRTNDYKINNFNLKEDDLLIQPFIVGKEYWDKGYFYNIDYTDSKYNYDYGFYSIGKSKYFDEYGNTKDKVPEQLGIFGVATISGIAYEINKELIIERSLLTTK